MLLLQRTLPLHFLILLEGGKCLPNNQELVKLHALSSRVAKGILFFGFLKKKKNFCVQHVQEGAEPFTKKTEKGLKCDPVYTYF